MSKVSFRARTLDVTKPMPIYRSWDIPDMHDIDKVNRAVVQMPTGMEKEEEKEVHLRKALQCGTHGRGTIPIPEVQCMIDDRYKKLYRDGYKVPKQYIHVEGFVMEQEIPDYDLDSDDERWLEDQVKKMEINSSKFEEMMDRLEKASGQQVVTIKEAKMLLKEDDDLTLSVYDYWLSKRLKQAKPLIPQVKSEKRDGSTTNNPYVAFRRRTEKMQTRKNRKNDESSYERMLKLRRDMGKALALTDFLKRREKFKKEGLQLDWEIVEKRMQMKDYSGTLLAEAEAERAKMPSFIPPFMFNDQALGAAGYNGEEVLPVRKKRQYRRRQKQPQQVHHEPNTLAASLATAASFGSEVDIIHHDQDSSEEDFMSPVQSPDEDENDPDGPFAFKRRKLCSYYAPKQHGFGNWSWCDPKDGGNGEARYRFSLTFLPRGRGGCFARCRLGRGKRIVLDRGYSPWNDGLEKVNLGPGQSYSGQVGDYITHIRESRIPYYRPRSPRPHPEDDSSQHDGRQSSSHPEASSSRHPFSSSQGFNMESYRTHREELLAMHREQEAQCSIQDSTAVLSSFPVSSGSGSSDLSHSFSSQPTSTFTLDSTSAQFAVSALMDISKLEGNVAAPPCVTVTAASVLLTTTTTTTTTESSSSSLNRSVVSAASFSVCSVTSSHITQPSLPTIMAKPAGLSASSSISATSVVAQATSSHHHLLNKPVTQAPSPVPAAVGTSAGAEKGFTVFLQNPRDQKKMVDQRFPGKQVEGSHQRIFVKTGTSTTATVQLASGLGAATAGTSTAATVIQIPSGLGASTAGTSTATTIVQIPSGLGVATGLRAVIPAPSPTSLVKASAAPGPMSVRASTSFPIITASAPQIPMRTVPVTISNVSVATQPSTIRNASATTSSISFIPLSKTTVSANHTHRTVPALASTGPATQHGTTPTPIATRVAVPGQVIAVRGTTTSPIITKAAAPGQVITVRGTTTNPVITKAATPGQVIAVRGTTPTSSCAGSALAMNKTVMMASGVGASSTMCSLASSSPMNMLKTGQEEGKSGVSLFAPDTAMPMDVS